MKQYYIDKLPSDIYEVMKSDINNYLSAITIQRCAIKMFYNKYGLFWQDIVKNFTDYFDYYCYLNNIIDPELDYINYYNNNN